MTTEKVPAIVCWDNGKFEIEFSSWGQLPQKDDVILHPDQRFNPIDDRAWRVHYRVYRTVRESSSGKTEVQGVLLFCDFDDQQKKGLKPFSALDANPTPPRETIHPEHAEAIIQEIENLAREAIAKNDWSDLFLFLSFRVPNWF
jgi:hypothetical protein